MFIFKYIKIIFYAAFVKRLNLKQITVTTYLFHSRHFLFKTRILMSFIYQTSYLTV